MPIKRKNTRFKMKRSNCSPMTKKRSYTCYNDESLMKLKVFWNETHPDNPIHDTSSKKVWDQLFTKMNNTCTSEQCWLSQPFVMNRLDEVMKNTFAPNHPASWNSNPKQWLSSSDIISVLSQFEKRFKCFKFFGPSPIDFDKIIHGECVMDELCKYNLEQLLSAGKSKHGFVFNTDPHNKGGEHWISLFINAKKGDIFFFDSAGSKVKDEIMTFVNRVIEQGKSLREPIHFNFDQNYPFEHQFGNTECGCYALFFIVQMLQDGISAKELKGKRISDNEITKYRKIYFNEP